MTETRRKALRRARGIVKRVENKIGYSLDLDLSGMSTRKLQFIDRKTLLRDAAKKIEKKESKVISIEEAKNIRFKGNDRHIERPNVLKRSGSKEKIEMLYRILDYGRNYMGERSQKETSGAIFVQTSAKRIKQVLSSAVRKSSEEEVISKIETRWGSVERFGEILERLVLAIYDDFYASWAIGGETEYEKSVREIINVIGGTDFGF